MGVVRDYLAGIGVVSDDTVEVFAERTRDAEVSVLRDSSSGVIFIDNFYVGLDEYRTAEYRGEGEQPPLEDLLDTDRRISSHSSLIHNRRIVDFGFGDGSFLLAAKKMAKAVAGVEIEERAIEFGHRTGIQVYQTVLDVESPVDTIFAFHVLEHLPNPAEFLESARICLGATSGVLVVEVPHARDFLLTSLGLSEFKDHTLWSQHLVLHTRQSLEKTLAREGFEVLSVEGVQRYGLGNHLGWLAKKLPGMHKEPLFSNFSSSVLNEHYGAVLKSLDLTDTLVAIARPADADRL